MDSLARFNLHPVIAANAAYGTGPARVAGSPHRAGKLNTALAADRPLRIELIAGSHATEGYESRQVRKEAAAVTDPVCRGEAQLSVVSAKPFRKSSRLFHSRCNQNDNRAAGKRRGGHTQARSR